MNFREIYDENKTLIIAEIAQAHDGSIGILHSLVEAAALAGVDAVKFQVHIAHAESSKLEPFRINFSYVDEKRYDYWRRMELSVDQWIKLKEKCDKLNIEFLATPFSNVAVDLLERLRVVRYKIGSGDVNNPLLLEKVGMTKKEVILSSGLSSFDDLDRSTSQLSRAGCPFSILQCTTKYPTNAEDLYLGTMDLIRKRYQCPVGLSDHSGEIFGGLGAVAMGAEIVECHITFDKQMFGPDSKASLTFGQLGELVKGIRFLEKARHKGETNNGNQDLKELSRIFGKALSVNRDMEEGEIISFSDLEGKKPSDGGVPVEQYKDVIGSKLIKPKKAWDFLNQGDFE
jgi:N,N'-diacetyllegionaminate synthase